MAEAKEREAAQQAANEIVSEPRPGYKEIVVIIERAWQASRSAVLEEAAQMCDKHFESCTCENMDCGMMAEAIRSLKSESVDGKVGK